MFYSHIRSVVLVGLGLIATNPPLLCQNPNGGPPQDATGGDAIVLATACSFPISISVTEGKVKEIVLGDRSIIIAPGQQATIKNLSDTTKHVTLNITGSFHITEMPDGSFVYEVTGRNLLWGGTLPTLTLALGSFTFTLDSDFKETKPLEGHGQRLNVCAVIS